MPVNRPARARARNIFRGSDWLRLAQCNRALGCPQLLHFVEASRASLGASIEIAVGFLGWSTSRNCSCSSQKQKGDKQSMFSELSDTFGNHQVYHFSFDKWAMPYLFGGRRLRKLLWYTNGPWPFLVCHAFFGSQPCTIDLGISMQAYLGYPQGC